MISYITFHCGFDLCSIEMCGTCHAFTHFNIKNVKFLVLKGNMSCVYDHENVKDI